MGSLLHSTYELSWWRQQILLVECQVHPAGIGSGLLWFVWLTAALGILGIVAFNSTFLINGLIGLVAGVVVVLGIYFFDRISVRFRTGKKGEEAFQLNFGCSKRWLKISESLERLRNMSSRW